MVRSLAVLEVIDHLLRSEMDERTPFDGPAPVCYHVDVKCGEVFDVSIRIGRCDEGLSPSIWLQAFLLNPISIDTDIQSGTVTVPRYKPLIPVSPPTSQSLVELGLLTAAGIGAGLQWSKRRLTEPDLNGLSREISLFYRFSVRESCG